MVRSTKMLITLCCSLNNDCVLEFVDTKNKLADIFTKPLPKETFFAIRRELGLLDNNDLDK